ncbi:Hypothetical predicted protein [Paramuricea clavata]|uniref:Uncharacterized protein n=1 Tax=Paramuricea clavata TaxID=317549 RepID=A0A7D9HX60_PARCT|nr:Hypothetical predicted protein [Paramuricea clavata]
MSEAKLEPQVVDSKEAPKKITKVKDPKKVEGGRELAKISKAAKEAKACKRLEEEQALRNAEDSVFDHSSLGVTLGVVGLAVAAVPVHYARKSLVVEERELEHHPVVIVDQPSTTVDKPTPKKNRSNLSTSD